MDLRAHLLDLVAPLAIGDAIDGGFTLLRASSELGLRLTFGASDGSLVHVELAMIEDAPRYAARTDRLALGYRTGGAETVDAAVGLALCRAVAARVAPNEAAVLARLESAREHAEGEARVREVEVSELLQPADGFETLSPYVGCVIGCRFCYAQSRLAGTRRLLGLRDARWGSWVDVRVNAPRVLELELRDRPRIPIKLCPIVSDPYQALERTYRLTRACLEVLAQDAPDVPVLIATRSALVLDDLALLARMPRSYVAFSIPTIDDAVRAHFEPRAASVSERLDALETLKAHGVRTCAVVQPQLPGSVDALADALASRVAAVSLDVLRGEEGAAQDFEDPRYRESRTEAWQRERLAALSDALLARGVALFEGELPPDLAG
ncbi:MAG: radical SAM protein [Sandaracinaceae bacterium]